VSDSKNFRVGRVGQHANRQVTARRVTQEVAQNVSVTTQSSSERERPTLGERACIEARTGNELTTYEQTNI